MKLAIRGAVIGIGIAAALGLVLYIKLVVLRGELGEKRGAAYLQGIEFNSRTSNLQLPAVIYNAEGSGYNVLGVPTNNKTRPHVWIILNEAAPMHGIYIMPGGVQYYVHCSYVSDLSSKTKIVPQVLDALKRACIP